MLEECESSNCATCSRVRNDGDNERTARVHIPRSISTSNASLPRKRSLPSTRTSKRKAKTPKRFKLNRVETQCPATPSQASLLGLPPELRHRIYQYIWPNDLIHVATRPCKPYDKGAWRPNFTQPTWAPQSRFVRWTHTVCQVPNDWQIVYEASKKPFAVSETKSSRAKYHPLPEWCKSEDAVMNRHFRHDQCNWIQESFMEQRYISHCAHTWHKGHDPNECEAQREYHESMKKQYGPASEGLERLYDTSKLSLRVLLTCKQLYHEAALLPYALNTFHFDYPSTLQGFVTTTLNDGQVSSLRTLQIDGWPWVDVQASIDLLPRLRTLHYACEFSTGYCGRKKIFDAVLAQVRDDAKSGKGKKLERVEVIAGCDQGPAEAGNGKEEMREQAAELEKLLMMEMTCK